MKFFAAAAGTTLLCLSSALSQTDNFDYAGDYQDYQEYAGDYGQQDNLYHDYAQRLETKNGAGEGGGIGMGKLAVTGAVSWLLGAKIHSGRVAKKLKAKHQKEQKQLYSQYYNDVYKLTEQKNHFESQTEQLKELVQSTEARAELDALQRDYDEFKQPDIDGDDRISRAEFNMYVKNYLSNYPGLSEKDYPKFDDFDHDGNGYVSFQEYSQQMALQAQQAELEELYSGQGGGGQKAEALKALYNAGAGFQRLQQTL